MPKEINTSGDRGLDRELDALWSALNALKSPGSVPASSNVPRLAAPSQSATLRVKGTDGSAEITAESFIFDTADGFTVTKEDGAARIDWLPTFFTNFGVIQTSDDTLPSSFAQVYQRVIDSAVARTLTLPNPTAHKTPIFIRCLSAPAGGHTIIRGGAELIDGVAADLTIGTVSGQIQSLILQTDGIDWFSLMRVLA